MICCVCGGSADYFCDRPKGYKNKDGTEATCDAVLCRKHAVRRGCGIATLSKPDKHGRKSVNFTIDYCPDCDRKFPMIENPKETNDKPKPKRSPGPATPPERGERPGSVQQPDGGEQRGEGAGSGPGSGGGDLLWTAEERRYACRVVIDYTNHRGERRLRTVIPIRIEFRPSVWHPGIQWIMDAHDCEDDFKVKDFALCGLDPAWQIAPMDPQPPVASPSALDVAMAMDRPKKPTQTTFGTEEYPK